MPEPLTKAYNGINGAELLEIVVAKLRQECQQSGHFELMLTYPVIQNLKVTVSFSAYPLDPPERTVEVQVPAPSQKPDPKKPLKDFRVEGELRGVGSEVSPDQVRADYGLGVPTPVRESSGIVDRLMEAVGKKR